MPRYRLVIMMVRLLHRNRTHSLGGASPARDHGGLWCGR